MALVTNSQPATAPSLANATDIRDIAPPIDIPSGLAWLWWTLAAIVLLGLAVWLLRWWKRQQTRIAAKPPLPAHVRARIRLQDALTLIGQPKPFVIAVSDAARTYLEERFNFRAPERTTEEFLYELQRSDLLTREQKDSLGAFLSGCDLVKFARYEPGEPELRELHTAALRLVDETSPRIPASSDAASPPPQELPASVK
ncbi:MAG: hypothetical protein QM813_10100 [Verrucomicrobiota bacterium]